MDLIYMSSLQKRFLQFMVSCSVVILFIAASIVPSQADPLERGIQGAIGGAIIGGVLKGGKGAGRGAAIGGTIGIIGGAIEEDRRRREYEEDLYDRSYDAYEPQPRRERHTVSRSSGLVLDIQSSLQRLGYEPGPIDGVYGNQTAMAIGQYQDEYGLLVTRKPSSALLKHMKRNGG